MLLINSLIILCLFLLISSWCIATARLSRDYKRLNKKRISGGYKVEEEEFPSFVGMIGVDGSNSESFCGGVLVGRDLILTSANCFRGTSWTIRAAATDWHPSLWREKGVDVYKVVRACVSDEYSETPVLHNDYQILRLETSITGVEPALLNIGQHVSLGFEAELVGIGASGVDSSDRLIFPDFARALPVKSVDCEPNNGFGYRSVMCFKSFRDKSTGAACIGDNGGPIFGKTEGGEFVVIAIVSFGIQDCKSSQASLIGAADVYNGFAEIEKLIDQCTS